jgi:hypothetical protein
MKTLFTIGRIAALVLFSFSTFAQSDEDTDSLSAQLGKELDKMFNTKIEMDIDGTLFPTKQSSFYFNEEEKAMIMTFVAPQSFAKAEEHFSKETKKEKYKLLESKKFTHNGKNILFMKGRMEEEGQKMIVYMYSIEDTANSTIFFTGMHMDGDEKKFFPAIERAALSAKTVK